MALQYSDALRNAQLDELENTIGASPQLQIRSGSPPSDTASADSGTLLVEITLPSDWMQDAASGSVSKNGSWSGTAVASGTAGHFRIKNNAGTTTHAQGTCGGDGSGADMELDNTSIANGQTVTINTFTVSAGNA